MIDGYIDPTKLLRHELNRGQLYQATVSLLRSQGNLKFVNRNTELGYNWLWKLSTGNLSYADVTKIEKLFKYLANKESL